LNSDSTLFVLFYLSHLVKNKLTNDKYSRSKVVHDYMNP
jgi:hypothetical protein